MSIYEKTRLARALLYWAKNNNGNECYYLEDRMYAIADGDKVIILTADSYDEAKRKAKGDYAITIDIQPEDAEAFKKAIENARVCRVETLPMFSSNALNSWRDQMKEKFRETAEIGGDMFHLSEIEKIIDGEVIE